MSKVSQALPRIAPSAVSGIEGTFKDFAKQNPVRIPANQHCAAIVESGEIVGIFHSSTNGYDSVFIMESASIGRYGCGIFYLYSTE